MSFIIGYILGGFIGEALFFILLFSVVVWALIHIFSFVGFVFTALFYIALAIGAVFLVLKLSLLMGILCRRGTFWIGFKAKHNLLMKGVNEHAPYKNDVVFNKVAEDSEEIYDAKEVAINPKEYNLTIPKYSSDLIRKGK